MADLGAIGIARPLGIAAPLSVWAAGSRTVTPTAAPAPWRIRFPFHAVEPGVSVLQADKYGRIAGTVSILNVPRPDKLVVLCYRSPLRVVDQQFTNDQGQYEFTELNRNGQYLVLALDKLDVQPDYDAMIHDWITPVS